MSGFEPEVATRFGLPLEFGLRPSKRLMVPAILIGILPPQIGSRGTIRGLSSVLFGQHHGRCPFLSRVVYWNEEGPLRSKGSRSSPLRKNGVVLTHF